MTFFDDDYTGPRWRYGLMFRPVGAANIPAGWIIFSNKDHDGFRHGTIEYARELTTAEIDGFELAPVEIPPAICGEPADNYKGGTEPCVLRSGHDSAMTDGLSFVSDTPFPIPDVGERIYLDPDLGSGPERTLFVVARRTFEVQRADYIPTLADAASSHSSVHTVYIDVRQPGLTEYADGKR